MRKLDGKIALISGGTTGIGAATATAFLAEGATVIATGSNEETLEHARREMKGIEIVESNAGDLRSIRTLIADVKDVHDRIDVLFVNAGISAIGPMDEVTVDDYDRMFAINTRGAFFLIQEAAQLMPDGAAIVLISSIAHAMGLAGQAAYAASKAAIRSFGRSVAGELAPRNIRVNTISPGPIITPVWGKITGLAGPELKASQNSVAANVPLGRAGRAEEVAAAAVFLVSNDASFITGIDLPVDGGWLALGRPM